MERGHPCPHEREARKRRQWSRAREIKRDFVIRGDCPHCVFIVSAPLTAVVKKGSGKHCPEALIAIVGADCRMFNERYSADCPSVLKTPPFQRGQDQ